MGTHSSTGTHAVGPDMAKVLARALGVGDADVERAAVALRIADLPGDDAEACETLRERLREYSRGGGDRSQGERQQQQGGA